jgi:hypothetical protein
MSDYEKKNELTTTPTIDGFDGFTDEVEGTDPDSANASSPRVIQGTMIKFTNNATYETRDGEAMPPDRDLILVDIVRVVQKWIDGAPIATHVLGPGKKFVDVKVLNDAAPKEEWATGLNGQPQGPWQAQYLGYLVDPLTIDKFTFATGTIGGGICMRDITDKARTMRRLRGEHVYPVVRLADTFMNTKFGGRQRPHFLVQRWVRMGGDPRPALPAPEPPKPTPLTQRPAEPTTGIRPLAGLQTVDAPSMAEVMNDGMPAWDSENPAPPDPSPAPAPTSPATAPSTPRKPAAASRPAKSGIRKVGASDRQ